MCVHYGVGALLVPRLALIGRRVQGVQVGALLGGSRCGRRGLGLARHAAARLVFRIARADVAVVVLRGAPGRAALLDAHLEHLRLALHLDEEARALQHRVHLARVPARELPLRGS